MMWDIQILDPIGGYHGTASKTVALEQQQPKQSHSNASPLERILKRFALEAPGVKPGRFGQRNHMPFHYESFVVINPYS